MTDQSRIPRVSHRTQIRPTDHPLSSPKFSDRERAAYNWLMARKIRPWVVDLVTKQCKTATANYPSIIAYARHLGWEG